MKRKLNIKLFIIASTAGWGHMTSQASLVVWQTAVPQTSSAFVNNQGLGSRLDLRCDVALLPCKWQVTTQVWIEDGNLNNYNLTIFDPVGGSETDMRVSNTNLTGSSFSQINVLFENPTGGFGGYLSAISAGVPFGGVVPPSIQFMHSYDLTMVGGLLGNVTDLLADTNGFGGLDPLHPGDPQRRVQMAANPSLQVGPWPNPVIRILHVPEPTSLSLLACGLALLGRRKRRQH